MWRPELDEHTTIRTTFSLPDGLRVALPWASVPGNPQEYILGPSPESASAPAVFGRFTYREIPLQEAILRVALPDTGARYDLDNVLAWLEAAATDAFQTPRRWRSFYREAAAEAGEARARCPSAG